MECHGGGGVKQRIQSSHIPPSHRHKVIARTLSVHCFAWLHRSATQTSAECCLEFTTRGGYQMFSGLCGSAHPHQLALGSDEAAHWDLSLHFPTLSGSPALSSLL